MPVKVGYMVDLRRYAKERGHGGIGRREEVPRRELERRERRETGGNDWVQGRSWEHEMRQGGQKVRTLDKVAMH